MHLLFVLPYQVLWSLHPAFAITNAFVAIAFWALMLNGYWYIGVWMWIALGVASFIGGIIAGLSRR